MNPMPLTDDQIAVFGSQFWAFTVQIVYRYPERLGLATLQHLGVVLVDALDVHRESNPASDLLFRDHVHVCSCGREMG